MTDENLSELREALADRYRIEGPLGEGGMAAVYLAFGGSTGRALGRVDLAAPRGLRSA